MVSTSQPKDLRIAYGARCVWWDSIERVGQNAGGLPCCPHCKGVLFEMESEAEWWAEVDRHEASGHPGYRAMWEWSRGRCFPTFEALQLAFMEQDRSEEIHVPSVVILGSGALPNRRAGPVDGLAALAHHVAREHGGRLAIDTSEMAGGNLGLSLAWEIGPVGEVLLVVSSARSEHH